MKKALLLILMALLAASPALAHTRGEVRAAYGALGSADGQSPYAAEPGIAAPYAEGDLTEAAREDALGFLNFARWLAGLEDVRQLPLYNFRCQHGAVLLAVLDYVDHNARRLLRIRPHRHRRLQHREAELDAARHPAGGRGILPAG